jgi:hypothetical protein
MITFMIHIGPLTFLQVIAKVQLCTEVDHKYVHTVVERLQAF